VGEGPKGTESHHPPERIKKSKATSKNWGEKRGMSKRGATQGDGKTLADKAQRLEGASFAVGADRLIYAQKLTRGRGWSLVGQFNEGRTRNSYHKVRKGPGWKA